MAEPDEGGAQTQDGGHNKTSQSVSGDHQRPATWARNAFLAEDHERSGDLSVMGSTGRSFQDTYPLATGSLEDQFPAEGGEATSSSRLGATRRGSQPRLQGILKTSDYLASPASQHEPRGNEDLSSDEPDDSMLQGGMPAGQTGSFPRLKATARKRSAEQEAGTKLRSQPHAAAGIGRFSQQGNVTFGTGSGKLSETIKTRRVTSRNDGALVDDDELDLPEGEPISDCSGSEEGIDDHELLASTQQEGYRFEPGRTGKVQKKPKLSANDEDSPITTKTGLKFAPGRTGKVRVNVDPIADFRPGQTGVSRSAAESGITDATRARFGATQRTLRPATHNLAATGFFSAAIYPTQRMNASTRRTKKDFSLGVQPAPDDSGVGLGTLKREHKAIPFDEQDLEAGFEAPDPVGPDSLLGFKLERRTRVNLVGLTLVLYYLGSLAYYVYIRITGFNLGLFNIYSIVMLVVECLGASTVILYGLNLIWDPLYNDFEDDPRKPGVPKVRLPYAIRVLVVCYKEDLECIQLTIQAAANAAIPYGCSKTIYLCDDGKDQEKQEWMKSLGPGYVYVAGRTRAKGESNGKSGNLNNVFAQIYPSELEIPGNEVLCIFDADQMACETFFLKTVPLLDEGDDVAMILTPQAFHNLDVTCDIFNHSNIHFWEYMQPGADCLGFISCTGTNFLVRSNAFRKVGGSPRYTMTEDYALGMELKKENYHCRYVREYLALGEAPHEVRNVFQQRSRWTKGHFQIFFQPAVCPLFQHRLSLGMRLMYSTGIWSYLVCSICTPFFLAIPVVTVWVGIFPLAVTRKLALAVTLYMTAIFALLFRVRARRHFKSLYFAGCCNQILWWAFVKAAWRAWVTRMFGGSIIFKATAKGKKKMTVSPVRDIWIHMLTWVLLTSTIACGIWQMVDGGTVISPLLISVAWAVYGNVAPSLVLWYAFFGVGPIFQLLCRLSMYVYGSMIVLATVVLWLIHDYSVKEFNGGGIGLLFKYSNNNNFPH